MVVVQQFYKNSWKVFTLLESKLDSALQSSFFWNGHELRGQNTQPKGFYTAWSKEGFERVIF